MSKFTVQRVEKPTEEQIAISADLFYDLMKTDLGAISLSGGDTSLIRLQAKALLRAGALVGEYYEATNADGELVGYTMWMPPGEEMFSTDEQRSLGLTEFMARLSEQGKEYYKTTYMAHFPGFVNSVLGPTGKRDAWWLHMAMVRPDYQRQGVIRALVNLVREKASKNVEILACSTTTDSNVPVYLALGFTQRGTKIMPSPWGDWPVHLFSLNTGAPQ
ncbi:hypothetical protein B0H34DRAFT_680726 [Crassisporium funariophilum]|nr:hypothetical protein B0H34DRAFT_680726 [Crassisporium funariophilum]